MSYRQLSILTVKCLIGKKLHKLLIVEFSPVVYDVSTLAYCQEEHLSISGYLWGKCYAYLY